MIKCLKSNSNQHFARQLAQAISRKQKMMTSSNGNIFRVTGPLCGEFTSPRWIPRTKASDAELRFFICVWINGWVYNRESGDLRRYRAHYDVTVMTLAFLGKSTGHLWKASEVKWDSMSWNNHETGTYLPILKEEISFGRELGKTNDNDITVNVNFLLKYHSWQNVFPYVCEITATEKLPFCTITLKLKCRPYDEFVTSCGT